MSKVLVVIAILMVLERYKKGDMAQNMAKSGNVPPSGGHLTHYVICTDRLK